VRYVVEPGDYIIGIAQEYGVFPGDILIVNGMTEDDVTNLQVGDVLIIPVEGCAVLLTPTVPPEPTNTPFSLTRTAPTITPPPTALNAQIVIANVEGAGNVNSEVVEIRNVGNVVNLQGWTLSSARGESFRFPEFRMQRDSRVLVFSRQGQNTPAALYWGREVNAWVDGDTVTLADSAGEVQAEFVIGETPPLFQ
jgi:LysM repeat protein